MPAQLPKAANPWASRSGCKTARLILSFHKNRCESRCPTHTSSCLCARRGALYSTIAVAQSIAVARLCSLTSLAHMDCLQSLRSPPEAPSRPRDAVSERAFCPSSGRVGGTKSTHPPHHLDRLIPSPLSCVHLCPAPPVSTHSPLQLPAEVAFGLRSGERRRFPTWGTLIRVRRLDHRLTGPAPDTTPAATLLARLVMIWARRVTLVGTECSSMGQVCPGLPPRHSFEPLLGAASFRRIEYRSFSLTRLALFARFGTVSLRPYWQGLDAPFIVELFTFHRFGGNPKAVSLRPVCVVTAGLPTPARVKRT